MTLREGLTLGFAALLALAGCGPGGEASQTVLDFTRALADSSYDTAWNLLTPQTHQLYDSTVVLLHKFGWTEARDAANRIAGEMTREEFESLTGKDLFVRLIRASGDPSELSTTVESVTYPDSGVAAVVLDTDEGLQTIVARRIEGEWLVDLTSLEPPIER
ncbi:hypothetical protein GF402_00135 [Candidatus Fermentibacteria bacterium]|nr:hypothetical protein [Candidatus Fermentibacteria bacterium]